MRATLGEEFEAALHRHRARTAVEAGGRSWTYRDLDRWSAAVADQLRSGGVRAGDAVALYLGNCVDFVVADVAVARMGAVKVPVNPLLPESTVAHVLKAARVRALVLGSSVAALGERAGAGLPVLRVDDGGGPPVGESLTGPADVAVPPPGTGAADRAAIYFTGGTTGLPKGSCTPRPRPSRCSTRRSSRPRSPRTSGCC
ncbi:acyl--CoA ligase [Pseudonocardia sp. RS11V-5]|uniref:class I adenylate-forming enzyme family protein n=1 Tax=Pseudonocardia terrae TaxID=2905831 RepID=UPI001E42AEC0|nr:class I adenylate-forming enzyme family protein [Pseudonocardia terrae]MCE3553646.1 acyl--CoA ligase [Pseudonocardia terrae]